MQRHHSIDFASKSMKNLLYSCDCGHMFLKFVVLQKSFDIFNQQVSKKYVNF